MIYLVLFDIKNTNMCFSNLLKYGGILWQFLHNLNNTCHMAKYLIVVIWNRLTESIEKFSKTRKKNSENFFIIFTALRYNLRYNCLLYISLDLFFPTVLLRDTWRFKKT